MDNNQFWQVIDRVNQSCSGKDQESHMSMTVEALLQYSLEDILDWHLILEQYCCAAYRPEVWAAGSVIGADYTDDGFIDFACWLAYQGKETYMNALRDPALLTQIPLNGEPPQSKRFRSVAYQAYEAKLFRVDPGSPEDLFQALRTHTLDPQTVKDIRDGLPPCSSAAQAWQDQVFPDVSPGAAEVREPQTMEELLRTNRLACGYVYKDDQRTEYVFYNTPENIAHFLGQRPDAKQIVITDALDRMILDTVGNFIDTCMNEELLEEIKKTLIPIQRGEAEAKSFFCPTLDEVDQYCSPQPSSNGPFML